MNSGTLTEKIEKTSRRNQLAWCTSPHYAMLTFMKSVCDPSQCEFVRHLGFMVFAWKERLRLMCCLTMSEGKYYQVYDCFQQPHRGQEVYAISYRTFLCWKVFIVLHVVAQVTEKAASRKKKHHFQSIEIKVWGLWGSPKLFDLPTYTSDGVYWSLFVILILK